MVDVNGPGSDDLNEMPQHCDKQRVNNTSCQKDDQTFGPAHPSQDLKAKKNIWPHTDEGNNDKSLSECPICQHLPGPLE